MTQLENLSRKLKLLKEVASELAEGKEKLVVMWVFDSFSKLVSNALQNAPARDQSKQAYSGFIGALFEMNSSMIIVAVSSSATTAGALNESITI